MRPPVPSSVCGTPSGREASPKAKADIVSVALETRATSQRTALIKSRQARRGRSLTVQLSGWSCSADRSGLRLSEAVVCLLWIGRRRTGLCIFPGAVLGRDEPGCRRHVTRLIPALFPKDPGLCSEQTNKGLFRLEGQRKHQP